MIFNLVASGDIPWQTFVGNPLEFDARKAHTLESVTVKFEPIQDTSGGNPSPSNICPITGWTGANVTMTGKNLAAPFANSTGNSKGMIYSYADNLITLTGTTTQINADTTNKYFGGSNPFSILLKAGVTYTASLVGKVNISSRLRIFFAYNASNKLYGDSTTGVWAFTPTTDIEVNQVKFRAPDNGTVLDVEAYFQLEVGTGTATYEPFQGTSLAIDWTTEAGTVYGGTIDVATGLLTVTNGYIASYSGEALPSTWISDRDVYSSGTTPTTGAQVVYALATPQTYQLTPQQVQAIAGRNVMWTDCVSLTVQARGTNV